MRGRTRRVGAYVAPEMGERARFYRLMRRKTIRQLASECGCSPDTIWRLENGRSRPTLDTLRSVADALNVGWRDLWVDPLPERPDGVPAPQGRGRSRRGVDRAPPSGARRSGGGSPR